MNRIKARMLTAIFAMVAFVALAAPRSEAAFKIGARRSLRSGQPSAPQYQAPPAPPEVPRPPAPPAPAIAPPALAPAPLRPRLAEVPGAVPEPPAAPVAAELPPAISPPQAPPARPAPTPTPKPAAPAEVKVAREPEFVEEKGFKGKIFDIKYRDPSSLVRTLQPLGSGFRGATMSFNQDTRTLSVRDFPENIAAIEEALKRLDVPAAPRPDIEFSIDILIASNGPAQVGEIPRELSDVVQQLKATLKYQTYGLMTSAIHLSKEGMEGVSNEGVAESKLFSIPQPGGAPTFYSYDLDRISLDSSAGAQTVNIGRLSFRMRIPLSSGNSIVYENVGFRSPVSLRQGDKVVVGSTTMGDKGLIVVVSAKVLK